MRKCALEMLRRRAAHLLFAPMLGLLECLGTEHALAAPPEADQPAAHAAARKPAEPRLAGFELLASAGYGASTGDVNDVAIAPYAASFGLEAGYTFPVGFRLGGYFGYGLGRSVQAHREGIGADFDFVIDASSLNFGLSLGYDVPLDAFVLRHSLGLGATMMHWDVTGVPPESVFTDADAQSPTTGFALAPGLALLWPHGLFECGVGFDYLVQSNGGIPPSFLGKLLVGVKL